VLSWDVQTPERRRYFDLMPSIGWSKLLRCRPNIVPSEYHNHKRLQGHLHSSQLSFTSTMNSFPRLLSGATRREAAWTCSSCAKLLHQTTRTPFFKPSLRNISNSSKPRQNASPTMEQMRAPFKTRNASTLYYTLSIILGTVAFSYGSVPMYKMVCYLSQASPGTGSLTDTL
jgi:hypothetical protein